VSIEALRRELLALRAEDRRLRQELPTANELGGPYHPRIAWTLADPEHVK
jgi:hypothetical protein